MGALFRFLLFCNRNLIRIEKTVLCVFLFSMIFLSFGQVVMRNVFSQGFMWIDNLVKIEALWVTFIGASLAAEYKQHIKIDLLASLVGSDAMKRVIDLGANLFALFICIMLYFASAHYVDIIKDDSAATLISSIPDWTFKLILPYCFFAICIRFFINLWPAQDKYDVSSGSTEKEISVEEK